MYPPRMFLSLFELLLLLISTLVIALTVVGVLSAPAPLPRGKPATLPVSCTMVWGSHPAPTTFRPDGGYECRWFTTTYVGSWSLRGRTLTIIESNQPENPNSWRTYTFEMDEALRMGKGAPDIRLEERR